MKYIFGFLCLSILLANPLDSQSKSKSIIDDKLNSAPPKIQKYFYTIDSLIDLGQRKWVNEAWSDDELKRYASILYDIYEYDPILRPIHEHDANFTKRFENKGWLIGDRVIFQEARKRLSQLEGQLVAVPLWLVVNIESMTSKPMENISGEHFQFTEVTVNGTITSIWKGAQYKTNEKISFYYLKEWGNPEMSVGKKFLVLLTPMIDYSNLTVTKLALGGFSEINSHAFEIKDDTVIDKKNYFGWGNSIALKTFEANLQSKIMTIKSWKWSADR